MQREPVGSWDWTEALRKDSRRYTIPHPHVLHLVALGIVKKDDRVLDLGCGLGRHTVLLAKHGCQVTAVDGSQSGVESTRDWLEREGLAADVRQADMASLPFADGSFDLVLAINTLYHGTPETLDTAMSEIGRVLAPGAPLLVTFSTTESPWFGQGEKVGPYTYLRPGGLEPGVPHTYLDREGVNRMFAPDKWEIIYLVKEYEEWPRPHEPARSSGKLLAPSEYALPSRYNSHWIVWATKVNSE